MPSPKRRKNILSISSIDTTQLVFYWTYKSKSNAVIKQRHCNLVCNYRASRSKCFLHRVPRNIILHLGPDKRRAFSRLNVKKLWTVQAKLKKLYNSKLKPKFIRAVKKKPNTRQGAPSTSRLVPTLMSLLVKA